MKRGHYLSGHKRVTTPEYLCVVDTETKSAQLDQTTERADLDFGMAWFGRYGSSRKPKELLFNTARQFWEFLDSSVNYHKKLWVVAHNMGGFDAMVLNFLDELTDLGYKVKRNVMECPPFFMLFVNEAGTSIQLVDSLNWMRMSLKQIGEAVGLEKLEDPGEANRQERISYCRRDVEILWKWLNGYIEFVDDEQLGNFATTLASQSLNAYKHRFMKHDILIRHLGEEELERDAYCGGRTEAFSYGVIDGTVTHYDVNSLYPSVMQHNLFPARFYFDDSRFGFLKYQDTIRQGRGIIARVSIKTDEALYPFKTDTKLIFPTGKFNTVLCGPELEYAVEHEHIDKFHEAQVYHTDELFTEYIEFFYNKRLEYLVKGDEFRATMCKLFMNSLYGKFGQRAPVWIESKANPVRPKLTQYYFHSNADGLVKKFRALGDYLEERVPGVRGESQNSNVAIAAYVTSYARMKLWEGMKIAGLEEIHYVDTDSLFMTELGEKRLIASELVDKPGEKRLGFWHREDPSDGMEIWGPKDYVFGGQRRTKGIRATAVQVEDGVYEQPMFRSFKGALNQGHPNEMRILTTTKHLNRSYTKGVVLPNGQIRPFNLPEEKELIK